MATIISRAMSLHRPQLLRNLGSNCTANIPGVVIQAGRTITSTTKTPSQLASAMSTSPFISIASDFPHHIPDWSSTFNPSLSSHPTHNTSFDNLIASLTQNLTSTSEPSLPQLHKLLRAYTSNSSDWSKYAHANPSKQYTRNLVAAVPNLFNLLLIVWTPGKASLIHDHADAHCLMKILHGSLRETRYAIPQNPGLEGSLTKTAEIDFRLNRISYMSDQLGLHKIENPNEDEYAVSLHLYFPPNAAIRGCRIFDMESGEATHVMQNVYDSKRGVAEAEDFD